MSAQLAERRRRILDAIKHQVVGRIGRHTLHDRAARALGCYVGEVLVRIEAFAFERNEQHAWLYRA